MSEKSIVLIGAGSTVFTPGLLRDLASSPVFHDAVVKLVDIDQASAETMASVGRRMANELGSGLRVEAYADRRDALPGARFVATTIAVGGAGGWERDLDLPARFGVAQTVGDSVGPGGVLRALRHIPELVAIAEDVVELAPDAWLINYSNPLTANVRAMIKQTGVRALGLCHGTMHTRKMLVRELGLPDEEVHAVFAGLNHLCWLLDIRQGTVDLYPRLRELVGERSAAGRQSLSERGESLRQPVSADLLNIFGLYPAPGDRHVAEFFAEYLDESRPGGELDWGLQGGADATREYIAEKGELWQRLRAQAAGTESIDRLVETSEAERLVTVITALITGDEHVELAVNVTNDGAITNLPRWAVVEVPALVGAAGIRAITVGELPAAVAAVLSARAQQQEIVVDAALTGSRELAVQALVLDPLVADGEVARAILASAIAADPAGLGRFGG